MQPCNLQFQDGCFENQYATYLLRSMTPKFLSAGRRCNLATCHFKSTYPKFSSAGTQCNFATFDFRMDALKISMEPTYFRAWPPNFWLPADDATLQPSVLGWMPTYSVSYLPATLQPCNLATWQPCNIATLQLCNFATLQLCNFATFKSCNPATYNFLTNWILAYSPTGPIDLPTLDFRWITSRRVAYLLWSIYPIFLTWQLIQPSNLLILNGCQIFSMLPTNFEPCNLTLRFFGEHLCSNCNSIHLTNICLWPDL